MSLEKIDRLILLIEAENALLEKGGEVNTDGFTIEKARCLMELTGLSPDDFDPDALRERGKRLRAGLSRNAVLLKAAIKVSETLSDQQASALRAQSSDGTYRRYGNS